MAELTATQQKILDWLKRERDNDLGCWYPAPFIIGALEISEDEFYDAIEGVEDRLFRALVKMPSAMMGGYYMKVWRYPFDWKPDFTRSLESWRGKRRG